MILIIVESQAKAKKIQGYVGNGYQVMASFGHVRDLPSSQEPAPERYASEPWAKLGVNIQDGFRPVYIVPKSKERTVRELQAAAKKASHVLLATDDDREGESISWHLSQLLSLKEKGSYDRMVFHEITEDAIKKAIKNVRTIDYPMVGAQESRRILDRLYGYGVSPLLWNAIGRGLSAGRVQSATLGLLAEQELKRLAFVSAPYWRINATVGKPQFSVRVFRYNKQLLSTPKSFGPAGEVNDGSLLLSTEQARKLSTYLTGKDATVAEVETAPYRSGPAAPFTTSTVQQEASVKLKLDPKETMSVAQALYDNGFITYMRTDSVFLSDEAVQAARNVAVVSFGQGAVPDKPRIYATKSANAQEAHEAIRPAGQVFRAPDTTGLSGKQLGLYELIYRRTVASQMTDLQGLKTGVLLTCGVVDMSTIGRVITDPGYTRMYAETANPEDAQALPKLTVGDTLNIHDVKTEESKTPAPRRFTEASLVKEMERAGIGRPATYASTLSTLQSRGYTVGVKRQLHVTFLGLMVHAFLTAQLPTLVSSGFTALMEADLDRVSQGELKRVEYLTETWTNTIEPLIRKSARATPSLGVPHSPGVRVTLTTGTMTMSLSSGSTRVDLPEGLLPEDLTAAAVKAALAGQAIRVNLRPQADAGSETQGTSERSTPRASSSEHGSRTRPAEKRTTKDSSKPRKTQTTRTPARKSTR